MSLSIRFTLAGVLALTLTAGAAAQDPGLDVEGRPAMLEALTQCRTIAGGPERLACYDAAVGALDAAERAGELVVVDREQVRESRRRLFGFSVPSIPLLERGETPEEIDNLATTITSARQAPDGKWVLELADGSVWRQIDSTRVNTSTRPGTPVQIRRAALGSYFLSVNGARSMRARRER